MAHSSTNNQEPGFLVRGRCGRGWFVPLEAVGRDYAQFLEREDGMHPEAAKAAVNKVWDFWPTWFAEQCCDWATVEKLGKLIKGSVLFKTKKALDRHRGSLVTDYDEIGIND